MDVPWTEYVIEGQKEALNGQGITPGIPYRPALCIVWTWVRPPPCALWSAMVGRLPPSLPSRGEENNDVRETRLPAKPPRPGYLLA